MARTTKAVVAQGSRALTQIDAELAAEVADLKNQVAQPTGRRVQLDNKRSVFLSPDKQDLGSEIQIVVLDFMSWNRYYDSAFDPNSVTPPVCYAFGKVLSDLAPPDTVPSKQADRCAECWANEFKTAKVGKGKACKNSRDIAFLIVDPNNPDSISDPKAPVYTYSVPPTGIASFDGFVLGVGRSLNGPPVKAIVTMKAVDMGTYTTVTFSDPVPNPDVALHASRREEVKDLLTREPDYTQTAAPAKKSAPARGARTAGRR